ncbi:hypothetical protein SMU56_01387 [Streptococcus mutans N29]|nr:hypothetical protein SMU56_01387 [Streptococcus mutans N29]
MIKIINIKGTLSKSLMQEHEIILFYFSNNLLAVAAG